MKINVKAKPNSHEEKVEKVSDTEFIVSVKEPPVQGRANRAIINALALHFGIASVRVKIVSGHISRQKVVEIL
ncbi:MAG TPA: DUF167 domain-containing protein [Candidatus Paceibacterota bacterium]|nr:DUF167 domain-containing protein [Candidatus Paceibacterota bacterium]